MVPPTPSLPTRLHIPADQSLLLATEPIWADDSMMVGHAGGAEGGDETFWLTPSKAVRPAPAPAPALQPAAASEKVLSAAEHDPMSVVVPRPDTGHARTAAGPRSRATLNGHASSRRADGRAHVNDRPMHSLALGEQVEERRYTGMTGRRDRRPPPARSPVKVTARAEPRPGPGVEGGHKRRRDSPEKARITKKRMLPLRFKVPAGSLTIFVQNQRASLTLKPNSPRPRRTTFTLAASKTRTAAPAWVQRARSCLR